MTVQCCKCNRVRMSGRLLPQPAAVKGPVTHGYCPECLLEKPVAMFNERASINGVCTALDLFNRLGATPSC